MATRSVALTEIAGNVRRKYDSFLSPESISVSGITLASKKELLSATKRPIKMELRLSMIGQNICFEGWIRNPRVSRATPKSNSHMEMEIKPTSEPVFIAIPLRPDSKATLELHIPSSNNRNL